MKRILCIWIIAVLLFIFSGCEAKTITVSAAPDYGNKSVKITDMAGRTVSVPSKISSVYSTGQPGVVMLYTLCPDKLLGWCIKPADAEADFIRAKYLGLPIIGLMQGSNSNANKEEIMARAPDVILFMTTMTDAEKENADELQNTMGIPVIMADMTLDSLPDTYRFLGKLLDESNRADELAGYCETVISDAKEITEKIPESEKLRVYYAQGAQGLQTAAKGSTHTEVLEMVGGINVVSLPSGSDGRLNVNMEQVMAWNPDVILTSYSMGHGGGETSSQSIFSLIEASGTWENMKAVQNGLVFSTPSLPYNWLDMPPSANRILGILWLGNLLYPAYYEYDIEEETKKFYKLFYWREPTEKQLQVLLTDARR